MYVKVFFLKVGLVICILLFFVLLIGSRFRTISSRGRSGNLGAIDTLVDKEQAPEVDKLEAAIKGLGDLEGRRNTANEPGERAFSRSTMTPKFP